MVPIPRPGWLLCGACGAADPVIRSWQYHTRPGAATVRHRANVHVKCSDCAALWEHGVAIEPAWWLLRPVTRGIRSVLLVGSNFEPKVWNVRAASREGVPGVRR